MSEEKIIHLFRKSWTPSICILGSGVIGLTTAIILARRGYYVRVVSNQPLDKTTSNAAAAFWFPVLVGTDPRIMEMAASSLAVFAQLAKEPKSGVHPARLRVCYTDVLKADISWRAAVSTTEVSKDQLPTGCACGFDASVFRMQMEVYLNYLKSEARALGVDFEQQHVTEITELTGDIVINCTGVYARHIAKDIEVKPIRGQVVLVSKPHEFRNSYPFEVLIIEGPLPDGSERLDYIVARDNDMLLGGTADVGDWQLTPRDEQREEILSNCLELMPELENSKIIAERVGLRPGRPTLRLATEYMPNNVPIVHGYGHGGAGVTLSWGTAAWIDSMVEGLLFDKFGLWYHRARKAA